LNSEQVRALKKIMATKALADKINKNRQEKDQKFEVLESIVQE
jgi:hypothetical protein